MTLEELDRKAWAGCIVDDDPEPPGEPVAMAYGAEGPPLKARAWFDWPTGTIETFERLLAMAGGK